MPTKEIKRLTIKQQRFIKAFKESLGNKKPKSIYAMLLEAGYSNNSALQQLNTLNTEGVKREMKPILKQLKDKRNLALDSITKDKLTKSTARDSAGVLDILIKNSQLLSGKHTAINKVEIDDTQYQEILKREQERIQATQTDAKP